MNINIQIQMFRQKQMWVETIDFYVGHFALMSPIHVSRKSVAVKEHISLTFAEIEFVEWFYMFFLHFWRF